MIGLVFRILISFFALIVVVGAAMFLLVDAMDKIESIRVRAPWIPKLIERRDAFVALLLISVVLLIGNGYELLTRELPDPAPLSPITFTAPPAPHLTIHQTAPPMKPQCWVRNYAVPVISAPPSWGLATLICNTTIKPPYTVELLYDQSVTVGPFTFPVGSEFTKQEEQNEGTKLIVMFDLHTIIPNEPFSIMAYGSSDKFPLVKNGIIRTKGSAFELHP